MRQIALVVLIALASFGSASCTFQSKDDPKLEGALLVWGSQADSLEGVIDRDHVSLTADGGDDGAALRVEVEAAKTIKLFEVRDPQVETTTLVYNARLRTKLESGYAFLEMWCHFPGQGEYFSRGLNNTAQGHSGWASYATPFKLERGQKPDYVKLNLVVMGKGVVWVDDLQLWRGPLAGP